MSGHASTLPRGRIQLVFGSVEGSKRYLSPSFVDLLSQEWEERRKDKLNYRYPGVGGESYQVLTTQLELCVWLL